MQRPAALTDCFEQFAPTIVTVNPSMTRLELLYLNLLEVVDNGRCITVSRPIRLVGQQPADKHYELNATMDFLRWLEELMAEATARTSAQFVRDPPTISRTAHGDAFVCVVWRAFPAEARPRRKIQ